MQLQRKSDHLGASEKRTWPHGLHLWPNVTIGTILGTSNISPPDENPARNNGQYRRRVGLRGKNKNPDIGGKLSDMDSEMPESHTIEAAHTRGDPRKMVQSREQ